MHKVNFDIKTIPQYIVCIKKYRVHILYIVKIPKLTQIDLYTLHTIKLLQNITTPKYGGNFKLMIQKRLQCVLQS